MAQVVKNDIDALNATLTVTVTPEDYLPKVNKELNTIRKERAFKGFRQGKTPLSFIRKMYGKGILAQKINDILQDQINKYLTEAKLNVIGQPIPSDDQSDIDFNLADKKDYVFKFDIGTTPDFKLEGLSSDNTYDYFNVTVPEDKVTESLADVRKRAGTRASVDEAVESNDIIAINADELDADGNKKENGWATTFNVLVGDITDDYRDEFIGKKKDDKVKFDIYNLESGKDEEFVNKYILQIQDNDENPEIGNQFEGTIADVSRMQESELNQEFFDKVFGEGEVKSEEEAKAKIRENMASQYKSQSDALLFRHIQEDLLEKNKVDLPDEFLRKFLAINNPEVSAEDIEKDIEKVKDNLRWSLIKSSVRDQFDIEVTEEDLLEGFKDRVRGYFGGYGDELIILNTANRLMEDQKQANQMYEELLSDKVFESIKGVVSLKEQSLTEQEMMDKLEAIRKSMENTPEVVDENGIEDAEIEEEITEDATAENE